MIEDLIINQKEKRLEYAITGDRGIICGDGECYYEEKLELYVLMKAVIKNWNESNRKLQL